MKNIFWLMATILLISGTAGAHDDNEGPVSLEPEVSAGSAGRVNYQFQLVDTKASALIGDKDLDVVHEKKLHMVVYDPALKEFQHVHPEFDGKLWNVTLDFAVNGQYWVWAQGKLTKNGTEFSASNRLNINGGRAAWPSSPKLSDVRSGVDGNSVATLEATKLKAGQSVMLNLSFTRVDGSKPKIVPFLGAFAHVLAVSDDGDSLLHVHPMDGSQPNEGMVHMKFPAAGAYRLWVQFQDDAIVRTISLSVTVE